MKNNSDILDNFGKMLVQSIIDRHCKGFTKGIFEGFKSPQMKKYNDLFETLNTNEKQLLRQFLIQNNNALIFDILNIFEANKNYKIVYEEDSESFDLNELSEMLKAELIIENGWLARFSREIDKDEIL